jgi:hypothetical protein
MFKKKEPSGSGRLLFLEYKTIKPFPVGEYPLIFCGYNPRDMTPFGQLKQ